VTGWLLDTNILSELRRPKPERKVLAFIVGQPLELLHVSSVTFAEIRFGIELVTDANRRAELNDWLAHKVRPMFEQRVLAISEDVMFKWRLLVEEGRKAGHTFSQPDLIIAATALHHGLTIASRDVSDYQRPARPYSIRGSIRCRQKIPQDSLSLSGYLVNPVSRVVLNHRRRLDVQTALHRAWHAPGGKLAICPLGCRRVGNERMAVI
jgi:predicted nucleic acid-binding protein